MVVLWLSYTYIGIPYTSACARARSKTRDPRAQTRESARQLPKIVGVRQRLASRVSSGRLRRREEHRSLQRDNRPPLQQRAGRDADHRPLRDGAAGGRRPHLRGAQLLHAELDVHAQRRQGELRPHCGVEVRRAELLPERVAQERVLLIALLAGLARDAVAAAPRHPQAAGELKARLGRPHCGGNGQCWRGQPGVGVLFT